MNGRGGATLYVSLDDGFLGEILKATGLRVLGRHARREATCQFRMEDRVFSIPAPTHHHLAPESATILAQENGNPVFSKATYGKGTIFFLGIPLEASLASTNGAFLEDAPPCWKIYEVLSRAVCSHRHIRKETPSLGITEHPQEDGSLLAVLMNWNPVPLRTRLTFSAGHTFVAALLGAPPTGEGPQVSLAMGPQEVAVWRFLPARARPQQPPGECPPPHNA